MSGFRMSVMVGSRKWTEMENRAKVNELARRLEEGFMSNPALDEVVKAQMQEEIYAPEELNRHGIRKL